VALVACCGCTRLTRFFDDRAGSAAAVASSGTLVAMPLEITANGSDAATVTVTIFDATGAALSGAMVALSSSRPDEDVIVPSSTATTLAGTATFHVTSISPGVSTISATAVANHLVLADVATLTFVPAFSVLAGQTGGAGWGDGVGAAAHFAGIGGIGLDPLHHILFVTEANVNDVRRVDPTTREVTTVTGVHDTLESPQSFDGFRATGRLARPFGIAMYGSYLYVADNVGLRFAK